MGVRSRSIESLKEIYRTVHFSDVEQDLGTLLHEYGEVHFVIDGLDEFAWTNPRAWLEVQLSLFKLLFIQSASRAYIRRVYITISLRNYVYTHALRDTHADRVGIGTGVVNLTWDRNAATGFLHERLLQVRKEKAFARAKFLTGD